MGEDDAVHLLSAEAGESHAHVDNYPAGGVRVNRKRADRGDTLTDDALKRGADLAAQQR